MRRPHSRFPRVLCTLRSAAIVCTTRDEGEEDGHSNRLSNREAVPSGRLTSSRWPLAACACETLSRLGVCLSSVSGLSEVRTYGSASAVTSWDARSRSSVRLSGWVEGVVGIRATRPPADDRTECPMHVYVMAWVFVHYMNLEWFGILTSICMPHTVVCRAPQPRPQMRPYTIPTQPCGG